MYIVNKEKMFTIEKDDVCEGPGKLSIHIL